MLLKKIIALLVLALYLHGMSGYTMSFHTCLITGFENVYAGYNLNDPCGEQEKDCQGTSPQLKPADCCDVQQTNVIMDENGTLSAFQIHPLLATIGYNHIETYLFYPQPIISVTHHVNIIRPPEPCSICIFRI